MHDVGPGIGLGHRRRMAAVAALLADRGVPVESIPTNSSFFPVKSDVIVVDSYRVRADERSLFQASVVVALDDIGRDLAADIVVDPSPGAERDYPASHRGRAGLTLAGARYAIVDPSLAGRAQRPLPATARRVLVTMGGAGLGGGSAIASDLRIMAPQLEVRLVVGPWSTEVVPDGVDAVVAPDGLAEHLSWSDVVVTAGGVTLLESLCLGKPTVAVVVADNQRRAVAGASGAGAAVASEPDDAAQVVASLLADLIRRRSLAERGAALVDGQGARRVVDAFLALAQGVR